MASSNELPIPDYDQLTVNDLKHRIRALDETQLRELFEHETAHGNRIPVLEVMHARLRELTHGAEPSSGDPASGPGAASTSHDSPVSEATAAQPNSPLRHGLPSQTPSRGRP